MNIPFSVTVLSWVVLIWVILTALKMNIPFSVTVLFWVVLIWVILTLVGCSTVPVQFHATERHCKYDRVGVEYALECSSKGTVELTDGPSLLELVQ